ncbi:MAG: hypothetical protein LC792_21465 [Actinobacteria bacterium]|nr:hypothetical protein [Actinomycetota bacterium]
MAKGTPKGKPVIVDVGADATDEEIQAMAEAAYDALLSEIDRAQSQ